MNIIFFTDMYNVGGGEKNLIELAIEMKKSGEDVIVFLPCKGQLSDELGKNKISYYEFGLNIINRRWIKGIPIFIDFFKILKIVFWLKKINFSPEIMHCNASNTIPLVKMLTFFYKSKIVWTCHGPWEVPNKIKKYFMERFIDKSIAITPEIYEQLDFHNKSLVPLGIRTNLLNSNSVEKIVNGSGKKRILCIARWQYIKGQDILLKAFQLIKMQIENVELHFFGDLLTYNKKDAEFFRQIKTLVVSFNLEKNVFFHGFISDIRQHVDEFDLLCIPSRYESFSITLLEGLNSGIIVIASNVGGPQYIIEDGVSGIFFEKENYKDLSEKCIAVLNKEIELDKEKILARGQEFSIECQSDRLKKIYKELVCWG